MTPGGATRVGLEVAVAAGAGEEEEWLSRTGALSSELGAAAGPWKSQVLKR